MRPPERESSFRVKQKHKRLTDFAKVTKVNFEDVDDEPVDEVILELRKHLRATGMSTKDANRLYGLCHQRNWPGQFGSKGEETDEMLLVILKVQPSKLDSADSLITENGGSLAGDHRWLRQRRCL